VVPRWSSAVQPIKAREPAVSKASHAVKARGRRWRGGPERGWRPGDGGVVLIILFGVRAGGSVGGGWAGAG
jgi:hypothetical protein